MKKTLLPWKQEAVEEAQKVANLSGQEYPGCKARLVGRASQMRGHRKIDEVDSGRG